MVGGENPQCKTPDVQKLVAKFTLVLSIAVGILSVVTAPKLGALSDRYGRKRLIVISSLGGIINEIITILVAVFPATVPYQVLVIGSVFDGLGGSFTAGTILSHSYVSDCTPPSKRGVAIGYLHACIFIGLTLGPLLTGYFADLTNNLVSIFYVTLGCHFFFILFITFVTPESLSIPKQMAAREKHEEEKTSLRESGRLAMILGGSMNPFAPLKILFPRGHENAPLRRNFISLALCDFVILGGAMAAGTIVLLYSELMFGWTTLQASQFASLNSAVRVFVLMVIFPLVSWYFRRRPMERARKRALAAKREQELYGDRNGEANIVSDELPKYHLAALRPETNSGADMLDIWLIRISILSDLLGSLGYIFVRTPELFYVAGAVTAFGGIGSATIQASVTKHVPPQSVGKLLGALGLLHAVARIVAPLLFNGLYAATVKTFPQAFFVLLSGLFGLAMLSSMVIQPNSMSNTALSLPLCLMTSND